MKPKETSEEERIDRGITAELVPTHTHSTVPAIGRKKDEEIKEPPPPFRSQYYFLIYFVDPNFFSLPFLKLFPRFFSRAVIYDFSKAFVLITFSMTSQFAIINKAPRIFFSQITISH